jgi:hypothetical protein
MMDNSKLKCANCGGNHSAAAPNCRKFQEVKEAWKIVANEGRSYAKAIKVSSSNQSAMHFIGSRSPRGATWGRADVIEPTCSNSMVSIPTAVQRQWAVAKMSPKTRTIETQTDEEPTEQVEQKTQTTRDIEVQTDAEPEDKKTQTTKDEETQSLEVKMGMDVDDKYIIVTLMNMCKLLIMYSDKEMGKDPLYKDLADKFSHAVNLMITRNYPV